MKTRLMMVLTLLSMALAAGGSAQAASCPPEIQFGCTVSGSGITGLTVRNTSSTGLGMFGTGGRFGVQGTGGDVGVYGDGTNVAGVRGYSTGSNGVSGKSLSPYASGVYGENFNGGYGVAGRASGSGTAVLGDNRGAYGWAGYFNGRVYVFGLVDASIVTSSFSTSRIDHPTDPANKYLYHSTVESPDMLNIYNGNVTTNANGDATVTMPAYFDALNRDFRYQLTVIGQFAQAIVASEVKSNQFMIKTDKPNVQVSWQVTGIRKDPHAEKNRIQAEVEKPMAERGTYLFPQGYGQPESKGLQYQQLQQLRSATADERLVAPAAPANPPSR